MKSTAAFETKGLFDSKVVDRILKGFMPNPDRDGINFEALLPELPESMSFPQLEHCVAKYWKDISAFPTHLKIREENQAKRGEIFSVGEKLVQNMRAQVSNSAWKESKYQKSHIIVLDSVMERIQALKSSHSYVFYEGPPFATGLPHYGHLLAATIKDVVCRYYSNVDVCAHAKNLSDLASLDMEDELKHIHEAPQAEAPEWRSNVVALEQVIRQLKNLPNGLFIERIAGWDCHGLPIEFEIEKELQIKTKADVEKFGIGAYNEHCRAIVMRYRTEWEKVVGRVGRWIDFDPKREYKTMNIDYMESVWKIFSILYEKGLIYCGFKVMPFSIGCGTPLSNFEANLDYRDVNDPSILVGFHVVSSHMGILMNAQLVAWTTTPWTLPANYALVVNPEMDYILIEHLKQGSSRKFLVAECRNDFFLSMMKQKGEEQGKYTIQAKLKGSDLVGVQYRPLFTKLFHEMNQIISSEKKSMQKGFVVLGDSYVSSSAGTGIVHCAPCFGEDDYRVCTDNGLISIDGENSQSTMSLLPYLCPIDENGFYTEFIGDTKFERAHVKEKSTESAILAHLKENGTLLAKGTIVHSYPFCWRSEVPLIYKAVSSWFVKIDALRDRMVQLVTENSRWVPSYVCEKRFVNWIKGVGADDGEDQKSTKGKDWAISRSRFWGTPLPIWKSTDGCSIVIIGSTAELKEKGFRRTTDGQLSSLQGAQINDLHRHKIDDIVVLDPRGDAYPPLERVAEVFDCWFESGCMPYAHRHYPFSYGLDQKDAEKTFLSSHFPANFIAEGLDQTRGWFYTLLVLGAACFDAIPFKNVIVNGLVLANDGRKMSKKLKNYPDPSEVLEEHGADALRIFFMNSNVVRAEPLRFNVDGVREVVKDVLLPLMNALKFFSQNVNRYLRDESDSPKHSESGDPSKVFKSFKEALSPAFTAESGMDISGNIMDRWIVSEVQSLLDDVHCNMAKYHLYAIPSRIFSFLPLLTNFYVRMNRGRMKGHSGSEDQLRSLRSLLYVLYNFAVLISAFAPFIAEFAYAVLRPLLPEDLNQKSVHFCILPYSKASLKDVTLEETFSHMRLIIEGVRTLRDQQKIPLKTPLQSVIVAHPSLDVSRTILKQDVVKYMMEEINVLTVETASVCDICSMTLQPNLRSLGRKMKDKIKLVVAALKSMEQVEIQKWITGTEDRSDTALVLPGIGVELSKDDVNILYSLDKNVADEAFSQKFGSKKEDFQSIQIGPFILFLNTNYRNNESLQRKTVCRHFVAQVQQLRKKYNFTPADKIHIHFKLSTRATDALIEQVQDAVAQCTIVEASQTDMTELGNLCNWIETVLQSDREEIENKLNAKILNEGIGSENVRESFPFYEKGITLTITFYKN